jgi:hypothetical protein
MASLMIERFSLTLENPDWVPIGFVEAGSAPRNLTSKWPSPTGGTVNYVKTKIVFFGEIIFWTDSLFPQTKS